MGKVTVPAYLNLEDETLRARQERLQQRLQSCDLCPRRCRVNRLNGEVGICSTPAKARVASAGPHPGEERPLVGRSGSGTIFFAGCNLGCIFCQNFDISAYPERSSREVDEQALGQVMLRLAGLGCPNINLVTPTHVIPTILGAIRWAAGRGLNVPLVYNSGGYDSVDVLEALDGVVDIYMPDFKYWSPEVAGQLCDAPDYPEIARAAIREMHRQVGDLQINEEGIAERGLLVRHLVLPGDLADSEKILLYLAQEISQDTFVNVMAQYRPAYRAHEHPPLDRPVQRAEVARAHTLAKKAGLSRVYGNP